MHAREIRMLQAQGGILMTHLSMTASYHKLQADQRASHA